MASIIIQFVEKTNNRNLNPPLTGRNVAAWPVSDFVQTPANGSYPTTQSPAATGTTDSGGNCTLTGLTGSALYYVSIVDAGTMPHWTQPLVAGSGVSEKLTYVPSPFTPAAAPPTLSKGELVFIATMPHGGSGVQAWSTGTNPISLPAALYDPYSASDGTGFVVPAELVGSRLRSEVELEYGGTTASAVITAEANIVYAYSGGPPGGLAIAVSPISLPAGNVSGWDQSRSIDATTEIGLPGVSLGETIRIVENTVTLGSGSSMAWGGVFSGTGFYTQLRVYTC